MLQDRQTKGGWELDEEGGGGAVRLSVYLDLCQNNTVQRPTGARDSRFTGFMMVKYDGEVKW